MIRILYKFLFFLMLFCPVVSRAMDLHEEIPAWIQTNCRAQGRSFIEDLLHSHPGSLSNFIKNIRFFGNMTYLFDRNNSPHPQSLSAETIYCFPADAITALIGHLFPSPDGELFVANQTGDPIGKLNPQRIGYILRLIEDYNTSQDLNAEEVLKLTLFDVLSRSDYDVYAGNGASLSAGKKEKYGDLLTKYEAFCCHDFKIALLEKLKSLLTALPDDELEKKLKTDRKDPFIYTKYLKYILSKTPSEEAFFKRGNLEEGELEAYHQVLSFPDSECELANKTRKFKNKEQDFKALRFGEILVNAIKAQRHQGDHLSSLPVERGLFFFFWQKAKTHRALVEFLSGYLGTSPQCLTPLPEKLFSEKAYWEIRNNPQSLKENLLQSERAFLLSQGYDVFERPFPFMRQYQTAFYEGKPLPDCFEITGSNFLDIISRIKREVRGEKEAENDSVSLEFLNMLHSYRFSDEDEEESQSSSSQSESMAQGYVFTLEHLLPSKHPLNLHYSWLNENPEFQFSQERRNRFAALCQRIPHLRYLKSTHGKGGEKDYELAPGFINFLNLMRHFFQDHSPKEFLSYDENMEVFTKELQRFCDFVSRDEMFKLTADIEDLFFLGQDYFGELSFLVNGQEAFTVVMSPLHSIIKTTTNREGDWRIAADLETLQEVLPPETLVSFVTAETLETLFPKLSAEKQDRLVHSVTLESLEMKIAIIKAAFIHNSSLKPFSKILMDAIDNLGDTHAVEVLMDSLMLLNQEQHLSDLEMADILQQVPKLSYCRVQGPRDSSSNTDPSIPTMSFVLFALKQGKYTWLNVLLPKITYLQLQSIGHEQVFLEFLKTHLSQCGKLKNLFLGCSIKQEETPFLCQALASLENLKSLSTSAEWDNPSIIKLLINGLSSSLEKFDLNIRGAFLDNEAEIKKWEAFGSLFQEFFDRYPLKKLDVTFSAPYPQGKYLKAEQERIGEILKVCNLPQEKFRMKFEEANFSQ